MVSPSAYWVPQRHRLIPVFLYGLLRDDFSIVLGQLYLLYISVNLNAEGVWKRLGLVLQSVLLATPVVAVLLMLQNAQVYFQNFFQNEDIPLGLVISGSAGQCVSQLRFVYPTHLLQI